MSDARLSRLRTDSALYTLIQNVRRSLEEKVAPLDAPNGSAEQIQPEMQPDIAPPQTAQDVRIALGQCFSDVRARRLDPKVASTLGYLANVLLKSIEISDVGKRLAAAMLKRNYHLPRLFYNHRRAMTKTKTLSADCILPIASVVLLALSSFARWPYGFYTILRIVVCGTCAYISVREYRRGRTGWTWIMAVIAVLFNPLIPIHFMRSTWRYFDLSAMVVFAIWATTK